MASTGIPSSYALTGCVVSVITTTAGLRTNQLAALQQVAARARLPLAVVQVVPRLPEELQPLRQLETRLQRYNIPLIILVGESIKVLPAALNHWQPGLVTFEAVSYPNGLPVALPAALPLVYHPYGWPGRVQTIDQLAEILPNPTSETG